MQEKYREIIRKYYLELLNREPDEAGLNYYLELMEKNEIDENKLLIIFQHSEEYKRIQCKKNYVDKYNMSKNFYGKTWIGQDYTWYSEMFKQTPLFHVNFIDWLNKRTDVKTVLEIGCGAGVYPIDYKELFVDKQYTGIDISESAIDHCKNHSKFNFICGDFMKMNLKVKYDLVFSHAVVDHVYDVDLFFSKIVLACGKYAYISGYYGYHPNLKEHEMTHFEAEGYYLNRISPSKIKETLLKNGLRENEFSIRPQPGGHMDFREETLVEIYRRNNKI